jgi:hypothetical protein
MPMVSPLGIPGSAAGEADFVTLRISKPPYATSFPPKKPTNLSSHLDGEDRSARIEEEGKERRRLDFDF